MSKIDINRKCNMKKIVFVVPLLAPYAEARYKELAKISGLEVHVIVEKANSADRKGWCFHDIPGVKMHLLSDGFAQKYSLKSKAGYSVAQEHLFSFSLRKEIKKINPDVVLACNSTQLLMLMKPRRYKLGVIVEDTLRAAEGRKKFNSFIKWFLLKTADFYCPFTEDAIDFLHANGIESPFIKTSWSMEADYFRDLSDDEIASKRLEYGISPQKESFILVANLIPRKGIYQFLCAWEKMDDAFKNSSELFIIGDGELKEKLNAYIQEKQLYSVHLLGHKNYSEVSHYLQCGSVFVLPTLEDLCSLSVLEAMAAKKPVLTTIYNGARQFVEEGVNGFIFDPMSESSIMATLNKIKEADIEEMSRQSSRIIDMYTTGKVMLKFGRDLISFSEVK